MTNPWIEVFDEEKELWGRALNDVLMLIQESIQKKGSCRIGLSGGKTPETLYTMLADQKIDWDRIQWVQLDERYVPSDHPESNAAMLRKALFKRAPIPPQNILLFDVTLPYASAAEEMNRKLKSVPFAEPFFDLLILGMGTDGHVASLFEDDSALRERVAFAACATAHGYETEKRLTLTLPILKSAQAALLLLKGKSKIFLVDALQNKTPSLPFTALNALLPSTQVKVLAYLQD